MPSVNQPQPVKNPARPSPISPERQQVKSGASIENQKNPLTKPEDLFKDKYRVHTPKQAQSPDKIDFVQEAASPLPSKIFNTDNKQKNQTLNLKAGERFAIEVQSNVSTGYQWDLDPSGLQPVDVVSVSNHKGEGPAPPGSGHTSYYIFQAPENGDAKIALDHGRSWDKSTTQHYTFEVKTTSVKDVLPKTILSTDSKQPEQNIHLKPGDKFAIAVNDNASTGYSWDISETGLQPDTKHYEPSHKGSGPAPAGSGGTTYYIFTVPESGKIEMTHGQSWSEKSKETFTFNINPQ